MPEYPDRQRHRPAAEGQARLLAAIEAVGPAHAVDPGALGEYAELLAVRGRIQADALVPEVASHLATGCAACTADLHELVALLQEPDAPLPAQPIAPARASSDRATEESPGERAAARAVDTSGIYVVDLPDPRAAEREAARRQRLRRIRDWLLIAAAVSIALIGLSLIAIAITSRDQPGPARIGLTPAPAAGRVSPSRSGDRRFCPGSHPIKGNRASMIYHLPGDEFYDQTQPEDCFADPASAEAAGYRRSQR